MVVGYDDAELLDIACVTDSFDTANRLGANPGYSVEFSTMGGKQIRCGSGLALAGQHALERVRGPLDTLVVAGGYGHDEAAANPRLIAHVRRLAKESRRVSSVCSGSTVLAAAGLLDGKRATTHWIYADLFAERFPKVSVDPKPLYVQDGNVYTAAGVTSALDLTLAFIEADHGAGLARRVARMLVTYLQRPGNQAQVSMFVAPTPPDNGLVRELVEHIGGNLDADLCASSLAARAGVSQRHLTRLFMDHVGEPPARFIRTARAEAAAHLLMSTALPLSAVARRCGFRSTETLRQAFVGSYGISPSRYRNLT